MPDIQSKDKESNTSFIGVEYGLVPTEVDYGTNFDNKHQHTNGITWVTQKNIFLG